MKKLNKKGFTLLELLIAIAIFTAVIFIGYNIFNKYLILTNNQLNINQGQLTVNDMNEYLTKDLEKTSKVILKSDYIESKTNLTRQSTEDNIITNKNLEDAFENYLEDRVFDYTYEIYSKEENEEKINVTYEVNITKYKNNYKYSVLRQETGGISITFINDETVTKKENESFELPFTIEGDDIYKVNLGYNGKNNEFVRHEFTVASRLYTYNGNNNNTNPPAGTPDNPMEIPKEPEKDDLIAGNVGYIKFEYGNLSKDEEYGINKNPNKTSGNIRVSVGGVDENESIERLAYELGNSEKQQIPIVGIIDPKDNNGKVWAEIDNTGDSTGKGNGFEKKQEYFGQSNNINALNITISEGCILRNLKINDKTYIKDGKEYKDFETGKYTLTNQTSFLGQIKVEGILEKTSTEGYITITFGTKK